MPRKIETPIRSLSMRNLMNDVEAAWREAQDIQREIDAGKLEYDGYGDGVLTYRYTGE